MSEKNHSTEFASLSTPGWMIQRIKGEPTLLVHSNIEYNIVLASELLGIWKTFFRDGCILSEKVLLPIKSQSINTMLSFFLL